MHTGGKNVIKTHKTKFKQSDREHDFIKEVKKQKKRDKLLFKLQRQEKDYVV